MKDYFGYHQGLIKSYFHPHSPPPYRIQKEVAWAHSFSARRPNGQVSLTIPMNKVRRKKEKWLVGLGHTA